MTASNSGHAAIGLLPQTASAVVGTPGALDNARLHAPAATWRTIEDTLAPQRAEPIFSPLADEPSRVDPSGRTADAVFIGMHFRPSA